MATKKQRSVFWVVSTHVLTTGFAMPAVAGMIGFGIVMASQLSPIAAFLLLLLLQALGYVGGVYYSFSYIRKVALVDNPLACVKPSIITFVVLAVLGLALNVARVFADPEKAVNPIVGTLGLIAFYIVITLAFARITQQGFAAMERQKETS
jgi:hypothetical protein